MTELLTAAQMRAIEKAAIEAGEVTGLELMERAGRAVVEAIYEEWPEFRGDSEEDGGAAPRPAAAPRDISEKMKRAVVLCGPGNNGGDGFVVARLLGEQGWAVRVFLYGEADRLPPDARVNYGRWCEFGAVEPLTLRAFRSGDGYADVYVDALFGSGLSRPLSGEAEAVVRHMAGANGDRYDDRTVAVDAPSGLCLDSGRVLFKLISLEELFGGAIPGVVKQKAQPRQEPPFPLRARLTVTFDSPKIGHFLGGGPVQCGKLVVKDIGLENWRCFKPRAAGQPHFLLTERGPVGLARMASTMLYPHDPKIADRRRQFEHLSGERLLAKSAQSHKFSHGHALVLTGGAGKTGAGRLAARGALRIGAGLVTLGVPPSAQMEVACQITALMLTRVDGADGLAAVLEDSRISALCLGPGLGQERARDLLPVALRDPKRAVVLDADALSAFADRPEDLFVMLHDRCVLTPHGGEFARLFPDLAEKLAAPAETGPAYSKVDATREAAARAGCVVLYKGADTVIASPNGMCSVHAAVRDRSAPWLATAGAGDVLAGFITGLMARGFSPHHAAETAAFLHVECARTFGPGLIAEDLPEQLPAVLRDLGC